MAFGLLWHEEYCMSSLDLMQVNEHDETIKHAYDWAGYEYEVIEKFQEGNNRDYIKQRIADSINNDIPVLAFGIIGPPECLMISGYECSGDVVFGWSHFQEFDKCELELNGMFRKENWYDNLWKIIITGEKVGRKTNLDDILQLGLSIMQSNEMNGYIAGQSAYDEWMQDVLNSNLNDIDDKTLQERHRFHHCLVGNHAEARYWNQSSFVLLVNTMMKM